MIISMSNMSKMFPKNLKYLRKKMKISQASMARALSMTIPTYVKLETGSRSPNLDELHKLATVLEIEIEELIQEKNLIATEQITTKTISKQPLETQPAPEIKFQPTKLKAVFGYVVGQVGTLPNVGQTVIYKLLYFIDFDYYEQYWQSITGLTYIHNHYGPTPDQTAFKKVILEMTKQNDIQVVKTTFNDYPQKRYLLSKRIDLTCLNGQELRHIDQILSRFKYMTANDISNYAHQDVPWLVTKPGQPINYLLAHYRVPPTSVVNFK